jgi:hypothetical protein
MILTRRNLIRLAGAAVAPWSVIRAFAASNFWDTKDPDSWTSDEIAKLLKKSPWAKEVVGERRAPIRSSSNDTGMPRSNPTGRPSRNNPMGTNRNSTRMPKSSPGSSATNYKGTVVWESAKVIRAAEKLPLPEGFDGQYVLSVTGIPLAKSSSKSAMDAVRQVSMLQVKNRDPLEAATVQQNTDNGAVYYIGFVREAMPIAKEDKEVIFTTRLGKVLFTAKFSPKEMLYRGKLAL